MNNNAIDKTRSNPVAGGTKEEGRKLQLVSTGSSQFGIFADEVSAIVDWQQPAPLPHAPSSVLGVVSIQGRMLTVIDLATLALVGVALPEALSTTRNHLIALRGDEQLALAVEVLGAVIQLSANESTMLSQTKLETGATPLLGVLQREGEGIKILNPSALFPAAIQGRERRQRRF
jgi:chemotaxis signal transduction protein